MGATLTGQGVERWDFLGSFADKLSVSLPSKEGLNKVITRGH